MKNVHYHSTGAVVVIRSLRGTLRPTVPTAPPWFEDPKSFTIAVDTAEVELAPASLAALLNQHVFRYPGSPLEKLRVSIDAGRLKQSGRLHKIPFSLDATLSATADGRLRMHPTSIKVLGLPVGGLMDLVGLELDDLIAAARDRGVMIAENDVVLAPSGLLPPPLIEGRVTSVRLEAGRIVTTFGGGREPRQRPVLHPTDSTARNYMFFQGALLRFGKLTMIETDLQIVDQDPTDPFDFDLAHLNRQLVAGWTRNQPDFGLLTIMPDYADVPPSQSDKPARSGRRVR